MDKEQDDTSDSDRSWYDFQIDRKPSNDNFERNLEFKPRKLNQKVRSTRENSKSSRKEISPGLQGMMSTWKKKSNISQKAPSKK